MLDSGSGLPAILLETIGGMPSLLLVGVIRIRRIMVLLLNVSVRIATMQNHGT